MLIFICCFFAVTMFAFFYDERSTVQLLTSIVCEVCQCVRACTHFLHFTSVLLNYICGKLFVFSFFCSPHCSRPFCSSLFVYSLYLCPTFRCSKLFLLHVRFFFTILHTANWPALPSPLKLRHYGAIQMYYYYYYYYEFCCFSFI